MKSQELRSDPSTHQLLGPHVVEDPLSVLTVMPALHDGQEQLGSIVLRGRKSNGITARSQKMRVPSLMAPLCCQKGSRVPQAECASQPRALTAPSPLITDLHNSTAFLALHSPNPAY